MYVYEEEVGKAAGESKDRWLFSLTRSSLQVNGRKLTEIINEKHENIKYLPGITLPENVVAVPSAIEAAEGADLLIFVLPHQVSRAGGEAHLCRHSRVLISCSIHPPLSLHSAAVHSGCVSRA